MIQYPQPVRKDVLQAFEYTFKDQDGVIIDLTPYVSAFLELKLQGAVYTTVSATINSPPTAGVVVSSYKPTTVGTWQVQFYCQDGGGNKLWAELIQFKVVKNVEDLSLTELAKF